VAEGEPMTDDETPEEMRRRVLRLAPPPGSPEGAVVVAMRGSPAILLLRLPDDDEYGHARAVIWTEPGRFSPPLLLDAALKFGYWQAVP
jgi:hypothetical protein